MKPTPCTNPTFLGVAVYALVGARTVRTSSLVAAREGQDGVVEFDTLNTTYRAHFTDDTTRRAFLDTCRTINRLEGPLP